MIRQGMHGVERVLLGDIHDPGTSAMGDYWTRSITIKTRDGVVELVLFADDPADLNVEAGEKDMVFLGRKS